MKNDKKRMMVAEASTIAVKINVVEMLCARTRNRVIPHQENTLSILQAVNCIFTILLLRNVIEELGKGRMQKVNPTSKPDLKNS